MLTPSERSWLDNEARDTLGLSDLRAKILIAVLEKDRYSIREVAKEIGSAAEQVRVGLEMLVARDLVESRLVGERFQPRSYSAVIGGRLRSLLDAVLAHDSQNPDVS